MPFALPEFHLTTLADLIGVVLSAIIVAACVFHNLENSAVRAKKVRAVFGHCIPSKPQADHMIPSLSGGRCAKRNSSPVFVVNAARISGPEEAVGGEVLASLLWPLPPHRQSCCAFMIYTQMSHRGRPTVASALTALFFTIFRDEQPHRPRPPCCQTLPCKSQARRRT